MSEINYSILVENDFDVCRICLTERGADGYEPFVDVTTPIDGKLSKKRVLDYLGVDIDESDDVRPKMICKCCFEALDNFHKLKKKSNESQIIVDYIARKKFGGTVPETSVASTSSLTLRSNGESSHSMPGTSTSSTMLRKNKVSSQEPPFKHSRLKSKKSYKFGDSMPGTSKESTSSLMLRNNEESSHSMLGPSKPSTSSMMLRKNRVSSQEPPFKHSRLLSKKSYKFGDSMPGTSKASTSSLMLRYNEESSQSMSGTSKASTSLMMLRNNEPSHSMPGTSKASTSSMMLGNNEISSQEQTFKRSQLPSKNIKYKFSDSMPGTSKSSTSNVKLIFETHETSIKGSQSIIRQSNKNGTNLNPNINNVLNDLSVPSVSGYLSTKDIKSESDDDCVIISDPIETVVLISDDEDDDNNNIENLDLSDDEDIVEIIELLTDSEDNEIIKKENINNVTEKLYYCSICQKKNNLDHDCSKQTKSFFTCLVPCCNVLSRSKKDFTCHYQPHIGMSSAGVMCHRCFKGIDQSNIDGNGCHIDCDMQNAFRCYLCNIRFKTIQEFAYHKLKKHSGILMDANYNYLCLYCEKSSLDMHEIVDHMNHCLDNQAKNVTAASRKLKKETKLLPVEIKKKNVMVRTNGNNKMIPRTSEHVLFTCLKPSCNIIFQSFSNFKCHHRNHFELGNALICWQCCKPLSDIPALRAHQVKNNCRTPGMYNCYECSSKFDDLENLSIHKLTFHEGKLVAGKKNRKTVMCVLCQMDINIFNFKSHLETCQKNGGKQNTCTTKNKVVYTCLTCEKVFASSISLSNHSRVHKLSRISNLKKEST